MRRRASMWAAGVAALMSSGILVGATQPPPKDLPGIISAKDSYSGFVPLKPTDVQFYLKIERATLDRFQHPTPQDLKDMAEANRLHHLQMLGMAKMAAALQAGKNYQQATAEMFQMTREQEAVMNRGDALGSDVARMLAGEAGMPRDQWDNLTKAVEDAAGLNDDFIGGTDYDNGMKLTAEELAKAQKATAERKRVSAGNRQLVAPNAAEIKKTRELILPIMQTRGQATQAAMTP